MPFYVFAGIFSGPLPCAHSFAIAPPDMILDVLDDEFVALYFDGYHHFLVSWKYHPTIEDTWITKEEFHRLDLGLLESYLRFTSSELRSFQPGGNDGDHI